MKKLISILLLLSICISFTACGKPEPKEISCEKIVQAYEEAGYVVVHHTHDNTYESINIWCSMKIKIAENVDNDFINCIYIDRYSTADDANAARTQNMASDIIYSIGELRWRNTGTDGDIYYSTFNKELLDPLNKLMK